MTAAGTVFLLPFCSWYLPVIFWKQKGRGTCTKGASIEAPKAPRGFEAPAREGRMWGGGVPLPTGEVLLPKVSGDSCAPSPEIFFHF